MRIISGQLKNRRLKMPNSRDVRPTSQKVRKAIFDVLGDEIVDKQVLDLFSGSGAIGFEALSAGAAHITFIENKGLSLGAISKNISSLDVNQKCTVIGRDVMLSIDKLHAKGSQFDIVLADPPYLGGLAKKCLLKISNCDILLAPAILVIEHSKKDELPAICGNLKRWQLKNYGDTLVSFYTHA